MLSVALFDFHGHAITAKISGAQVLFPITYIFGDIFTEVYGYGASRRAIWLGFFACTVLSLMGLFIVWIPAAPGWPNQAAFEAVFYTVPRFIVASEDATASNPLGGDPDLQVRCLVPDTMSFDFAVNTMTYQPGAALSMVEMHVMEHGLMMLEGGGIYRLGDSWYPVTAGDFIWMGPWCPQWFGAIGKVPAKYLIYKDWNRHPLV